jgi:uncharacterized protein YdiU (UPF0061 family)
VCWASVTPTPVEQPLLLAYSTDMLRALDLTEDDIHSEPFLAAFSGNRLLEGMVSFAACYGGHQFGNWAGQLGDGRAISLCEVISSTGVRSELQLKGAGMTPYSRNADGRAVLRSSIREFLCSEAMHHLGIPTTRALCLIGTGEKVRRDMFYDGNPAWEQGAIVCRVSPSFIRFGNFEILAFRREYDLLQRLIDFTILRDFPEIVLHSENYLENWFKLICQRTALLVVQWLRVGFVHGVMNTDNMSIMGLTLDYGPYGWIDNFDPGWTPNTTDADFKRYTLSQQPVMARWNLARLADALSTVLDDRSALDIGWFDEAFAENLSMMLAAKFGFLQWRDKDAELVDTIFELMHRAEVDMTEFFRALATISQHAPDLKILQSAFYKEALYQNHSALFQDWLIHYAERLSTQQDTDEARRIRMNQVNPRFILRNYLAQQAIEAAMQNDMSVLHKLMAAACHPYDESIAPELTAIRPDWAINKPGCSMLSCSS